MMSSTNSRSVRAKWERVSRSFGLRCGLVARQPDRAQPTRALGEGRTACLTRVAAAVVQHQDDPAMPIFGIDKFMSEYRALTNVCGNTVASIFVSKWEGK